MSALGLGLIAAFAWGFHDICVRYVSQSTPLLASLLAVLLAGLGFHLVLMVGGDGFASVTPKAAGLAVVAGGFFLVASLGLYGAFQRGPVRLVSPIIASFPILSVIWAASNGVTVTLVQWLAVFAILGGVSVVATLSDEREDESPPKLRTIFYAAVSSVGFAGTFAIGQMASEMAHHLPISLITRSTAIVLLVAIILALKVPFWPGRKSLWLLGLMGLADGTALLCMVAAGGLPDAQFASVAASVFGLLTIVIAWGFLGERMSLPQWFWCLVTFAGIGYLAL
jgi:drug/metabolite transporter (DMT)-like permease